LSAATPLNSDILRALAQAPHHVEGHGVIVVGDTSGLVTALNADDPGQPMARTAFRRASSTS
jgi:hypothetical protein